MQFGKSSMAKLNTCHRDLQTIMLESIKCTDVDFGITHGHRTPEEQFELFKQGRKLVNGKWIVEDYKKVVTDKDGFDNKSRHNQYPSHAVDIVAYVNGKYTWDKDHMLYLMGLVKGIANKLFIEGTVGHQIKNGANWDNDGEIIHDHTFIDLPHFEIIWK